MSQNNPLPKINSEKGDGQKKGPKFTIYWIYAIIAIVLLSMQFLRMSPDLAPTSQQEYFDQMLIPGDVQKIEFYVVQNGVNHIRTRIYTYDDKNYAMNGILNFHKIKNWHTFGKEEAWQLALE